MLFCTPLARPGSGSRDLRTPCRKIGWISRRSGRPINCTLRAYIVSRNDEEIIRVSMDANEMPVGIHRARNMRHILTVETSDDMNDRINLSYLPQELVAESLSFRRTFDESGDIHKLDRGRCDGR